MRWRSRTRSGPRSSAGWARAVPIISCARASRRCSCPWIPRAEGLAALKTRIAERLEQYREDYAAYYSVRCRDSPALRDSNPSVVVIPGLGLFGFGKDKREARITSEFFVNAIHVMAGANALGDASGDQATGDAAAGAACRSRRGDFKSFHNYVALPRSEAFRIEYWALEEAKLQRMPPEKEFSRKIAWSSAAAAASAAKWRCRSRGAAGTSSSPT